MQIINEIDFSIWMWIWFIGMVAMCWMGLRIVRMSKDEEPKRRKNVNMVV